MRVSVWKCWGLQQQEFVGKKTQTAEPSIGCKFSYSVICWVNVIPEAKKVTWAFGRHRSFEIHFLLKRSSPRNGFLLSVEPQRIIPWKSEWIWKIPTLTVTNALFLFTPKPWNKVMWFWPCLLPETKLIFFGRR
jgi:hypothetical protein